MAEVKSWGPGDRAAPGRKLCLNLYRRMVEVVFWLLLTRLPVFHSLPCWLHLCSLPQHLCFIPSSCEFPHTEHQQFPQLHPHRKSTSLEKDTLSTTTGSGEGSRIFYHLHKFLKWLLHQFSTLVHSVKPELPKISTNTHTFPVNFLGSLLLVYAILQLPSGALKSTCDETLMSELISCGSEWANLPPLC